MPSVYPWSVLNARGEVVGYRRTEADARALIRMLLRASPKAGPYTCVGPRG